MKIDQFKYLFFDFDGVIKESVNLKAEVFATLFKFEAKLPHWSFHVFGKHLISFHDCICQKNIGVVGRTPFLLFPHN